VGAPGESGVGDDSAAGFLCGDDFPAGAVSCELFEGFPGVLFGVLPGGFAEEP